MLDEVLSNERIEVLACADGWCRIQYGSGVGYVSQAALDGPRATLPTEGAQSCFVQPIAGYHGGPDVRFCTSAPAH